MKDHHLAILLIVLAGAVGAWAAKSAPDVSLCDLAGTDRQALADVYESHSIWMLGYPPIVYNNPEEFWILLECDLVKAGVEDSPVVPVVDERLQNIIKRSTKWTKGLVNKLERELWDTRNELEYCN
jgi:hypothetical protein